MLIKRILLNIVGRIFNHRTQNKSVTPEEKLELPILRNYKIKMMKTLKKFGLDYCDLSTMLWNVTVILRGGTVNINRMFISKRMYVSLVIRTTWS